MKSILLTLLLIVSIPLQSQDTLKWYALNSYFSENSTLTVPIKCQGFDSIFAFQYGIRFDTNYLELDSMTLTGILPEYDSSNFGFSWIPPHLIPKNSVTTLWTHATGKSVSDGTVIYNLHFSTRQSGWLEDVLFASSQLLVFECIDETMTEIGIVFEVVSESQNQNTTAGMTEISENFSIYPNPIDNYLSIHSDKFGQLSIYDAVGKLEQTEMISSELSTVEIFGCSGIKIIVFRRNDGVNILQKIIKN